MEPYDGVVSKVFDVIVAGLGAMGSAALAACASRGVSAAGFDRYPPENDLGASSGKSRLIRQAYFEDPAYVALVLRAYELWYELERQTQEPVFRKTGLLMCGRASSRLISGSLTSARKFDLPVGFWEPKQIRRKYPQVNVLEDEVGIFEESGGVLFPEAIVRAQVALAQRRGATVEFNVSLRTWTAGPQGIDVEFSDGTVLRCKRLILALGPWSKPVLELLGVPLRVQRNVQAWFAPANEAFAADRFPAFMLDRDGLPAIFYGFPEMGDGVKAAFHGLGADTEAENVDRSIHGTEDVEPITRALESWMPGAAGRFVNAKTCLYALTPDEHFVVDVHPDQPGIVLLGGFSGHGFKFASVIGEIAADLALDGGTRYPIEFLSLRRFA